MIHVLATIELHPGTRDRFLREFAQLEPQVRAEEGCLEYAAAVELDTGLPGQLPARPDAVVVVEKWSSLAALGAHAMAPHMQAYRGRVKGLVIRTTLQILAPAEVSGAPDANKP